MHSLSQKVQMDLLSLQKEGIKPGLGRMQKALDVLGHPEKNFQSIHIGGTNGKGSTAAVTASILKSAGYKVGLAISPHILDLRERIQICGQWISIEDFSRIHEELWSRFSDQGFTYFEWLILITFVYFSDENIDWAVIEVGLGGRLDATNLIIPQGVILTNISMDHQAFLGNTLEKILGEKMAIIKSGSFVWSDVQIPRLKKILMSYCHDLSVELFCLTDCFVENPDDSFRILHYDRLSCKLAGNHQKRNAALAVGLLDCLRQKRLLDFTEKNVRESLSSVSWPGRFEVFQKKPLMILDGAHNEDGIRVLYELLEKRKFQKLHLLFGCLEDRDLKKLINPLKPMMDKVTLAFFEGERSRTLEAVYREARELSEIWNQSISVLIVNRENWIDFIQRQDPDSIILVCGSLYLLSRVRSYL